MHFEGKAVAQSCSISTFSELTVAPEWGCVKIDDDLSLRAAALVGCAVPTGWGSAVNAAAVSPGDVVIVAGIGGIGINAVQGAKHAGAGRILAVDPLELKRNFALGCGATHAFATIAEATEYAKSVTNGQGADSAILTMGTLEEADTPSGFAAIRKGGTVVVTAAGSQDLASIPVNLLELTMYQKRIQGSMFGMMSPSKDIPRLLDLYRVGALKLDELISQSYQLDQINEGFDDLEAGRIIRGMIDFDTV
jgi:S-(hydroxymethyl)glutathione dehydrogenase/alcohol dehydrogenase